MADSEDNDNDQRSTSSASPADVIRAARQQFGELSGFSPESVSEFARSDSGWEVHVEVCELQRVPATTDVLATYVVELDGQGHVQGYRRVRRYYRNQATAPE